MSKSAVKTLLTDHLLNLKLTKTARI